MTELDKLEQYLKGHNVPYERFDEDEVHAPNGTITSLERRQIIVYDENGNRIWDAVCHYGSYGYSQGLLEVMGSPVIRKSDGDSVKVYLTAQDVIDRWEGRV